MSFGIVPRAWNGAVCSDMENTMHVTIFDSGVNLDAENEKDLMSFWHMVHLHPVCVARRIFPQAPKGYTSVTKDLGAYAYNKATAIRCRVRGAIERALMYEGICERIWNDLPAFARW